MIARNPATEGASLDGVRPADKDFSALDRPVHSASMPTAIDLFCGAGGLSLGLASAGFDVRFAADWSESCAETHQRNLPSTRLDLIDAARLRGKDIRRRTGLARGDLDLLAGGPPCQGFSILGHRETTDPRNRLFWEFIRIAEELRPRAVLIENVTGLATLGGRRTLQDIGASLDRIGYSVACAELRAAQYGVPQMRWRMIFIAWRRDTGLAGGFPLPSHGSRGVGDLLPNRPVRAEESRGFVTVAEAIGDLPAIGAGETGTDYTSSPRCDYQRCMRRHAQSVIHNHYAARLSDTNLRRIRLLRPGQDWRDLPRNLLPPGMQRALRKDHTRRFRRMTWDGVPRAIITRFRDPKSGEYTHPDQDRTISIREAARIQSFPDWFVFHGRTSDQYEQVGNAVPPLLARAVGREVLRVLAGGPAVGVGEVKSRYVIART